MPDPGRAGVAETHSGIVFFTADRAYKLKKPLDLGFLDFRRREVRQAACQREVELNSRLAPDVYLGVADVRGPDGALCDHMVVMRRLPGDRRLSTLATAGQVAPRQVRGLARLLASFHSRAATSAQIDETAGRDAQAVRWEANAAEMTRFVGPVFDPAVAERVITMARRYLAGREDLFAARVAAGRARDGHGDLLAGDIFLLEDGPRVLDCLEFDDRLRWGDVLSDVAFLAMDLEHLGRADLGRQLLADYREFAGDSWPDSLAHHHIAYRAQVRAKVTALAWEQAGEGDPGRSQAVRVARSLLERAERHLSAGQVRLVVVGGLPGSGKSTLAAGLGEALGAAVIRSDEVRKQLGGLSPAMPAPSAFGEGLYRPEMTQATYRDLLGRARASLANGRSVVADASWHDPAWRAEARALARDASAELTELRCDLPVGLIRERVTGRLARGGDASDATADLVVRLAASAEPWPTSLTVDTTPSPEVVLSNALGLLAAGTSGGNEGRPRWDRPLSPTCMS